MTQTAVALASLELQDVTHQLVQQFIGELQDMLPDLMASRLTASQMNVLDKIVVFFDKEMKDHHREEESHVFPWLLQQGDPKLSEKVRILQSDHEQLRLGWQELKTGIAQAQALSLADSDALRASFERYSVCFVRHLVLEESIQFSPETQALFKRWDQ